MINSLSPSELGSGNGYRLLGTKPLSEPLMTYFQFGLELQTALKFESELLWNKMHSKLSTAILSWGQWIKVE